MGVGVRCLLRVFFVFCFFWFSLCVSHPGRYEVTYFILASSSMAVLLHGVGHLLLWQLAFEDSTSTLWVAVDVRAHTCVSRRTCPESSRSRFVCWVELLRVCTRRLPWLLLLPTALWGSRARVRTAEFRRVPGRVFRRIGPSHLARCVVARHTHRHRPVCLFAGVADRLLCRGHRLLCVARNGMLFAVRTQH